MKKNIENCKSLRTVTHAGSGNMREIVTLEDLIGLVCNGIDQTKARLLSIFRRIHRCSFSLLSELHSVILSIFSI